MMEREGERERERAGCLGCLCKVLGVDSQTKVKVQTTATPMTTTARTRGAMHSRLSQQTGPVHLSSWPNDPTGLGHRTRRALRHSRLSGTCVENVSHPEQQGKEKENGGVDQTPNWGGHWVVSVRGKR
jgi:hypothetical protein